MQSSIAFSTVASQQEDWESDPQLQQTCVELVCALVSLWVSSGGHHETQTGLLNQQWRRSRRCGASDWPGNFFVQAIV